MIVNTAPENTAFLSNVGSTSNFAIKATAKSFQILSSGLYSNKIRAIIRELSCNAHDSHVAAGVTDRPFDVHLPTDLEPWFSVRDYGVGLDAEQVTTLYTTYFESTKTASNEFIGALGLGSKSPFSYTDNFTVTAIKHGKKGIYSAFINAEGVPSIALMLAEDTAEPTGVEVKFSVNSRGDFYKFCSEAAQVFQYFQNQPCVSGNSRYQVQSCQYLERDLVPGVHHTGRQCVAVMGNIAYPIEVPNAQENLGDLCNLLHCGLEMHFGIGELDIQASREGLSYIPETINSIRQRLQAVQAILDSKLASDADAIPNLWERAVFLSKRPNQLWGRAVDKYVTATQFPLLQCRGSYTHLSTLVLDENTLAEKYNVVLQGFSHVQGNTLSRRRAQQVTEYDATPVVTRSEWQVPVREDVVFVVNDLRTGALERACYHWRNDSSIPRHATTTVIVVSAADRSKLCLSTEFFASIHEPPRRMMASDLLEKPRKKSLTDRNFSVMQLVQGRRDSNATWSQIGRVSDTDDNCTHYYLPLNGFRVQSALGEIDAKQLFYNLSSSGVSCLTKIAVMGVRRADLETVKKLPNWINLEQHLQALLPKIQNQCYAGMTLAELQSTATGVLGHRIASLLEEKHEYAQLVSQLQSGTEFIRCSEHQLTKLFSRYAAHSDFAKGAKKFYLKTQAQWQQIQKRYPLLKYLGAAPAAEVAQYIQQLDQSGEGK
jgi:hypothetical protein